MSLAYLVYAYFIGCACVICFLILADGRFSVPEKIAIITSGIFFGVFVIKTTRSRMRKNDTYINTKIDTMKK